MLVLCHSLIFERMGSNKVRRQITINWGVAALNLGYPILILPVTEPKFVVAKTSVRRPEYAGQQTLHIDARPCLCKLVPVCVNGLNELLA
jgi:hypothetical protein